MKGVKKFTKISASTAIAAIALIIPWEGANKNKDGYHIAYLDVGGVPTACYGQTGKDHLGRVIREGMVYTEDECLLMLENTLVVFEKSINRLVKDWKSSYQQAAVTSFTYNVGVGSLESSTLLKLLNSGKHSEACDQLQRWVYVKGKKVRGLINRRGDEWEWCMGKVDITKKSSYESLLPYLIEH